MAITILPPVVEDVAPYHADSDDSMSGADSDSDVEMSGVSRPNKKARTGNGKISSGIVTPGEVITADPQWMR
jgi:exosome complex component RRP4